MQATIISKQLKKKFLLKRNFNSVIKKIKSYLFEDHPLPQLSISALPAPKSARPSGVETGAATIATFVGTQNLSGHQENSNSKSITCIADHNLDGVSRSWAIIGNILVRRSLIYLPYFLHLSPLPLISAPSLFHERRANDKSNFLKKDH